MANRALKVIRLCKTPTGEWKRYPVVYEKGRIKHGAVFVNGEEQKYPIGQYQVRWYESGITQYRSVGDDPDEAIKAHLNQAQILDGTKMPEVEGVMLNLPKSLLGRAKQIAADEGASLDAWVTMVVTEKIGALKATPIPKRRGRPKSKRS